MNLKRNSLLPIFVIVIFSFSSFSQERSTDLQRISQTATNYVNRPLSPAKRPLHTSWNPIKMTAYLPLYFYQSIISEQISAVCEFDLTCSSFCIQSIKEFGIIKGIMLTTDRLDRCNGAAQPETQNYLFNPKTGKVIDVPKMYHY